MAHINHLHDNFDVEKAEFTNVRIEQVSMVGLPSYSVVEGLATPF